MPDDGAGTYFVEKVKERGEKMNKTEVTSDEAKRYKKCFYYEIGSMSEIKNGHVHFCAPEEAKTLGDRWKMKKEINPEICETCERYKSRFIEFPLMIKGLELRSPEYWNNSLKSVRIRPCGGENTYFGIYLGEFPRHMYAELNEETGILEVSTLTNPGIYVPELEKIVFGDESWWSEIEPGEDVKGITDETIKGQWYMKLLDEITKKKEEQA